MQKRSPDTTRFPLGDGSTKRDSDASTDAELIRRHRAGDGEALTALVARWEGPIFRIARRITGSTEDAEDVRQEIFLRLLTTSGTIERPEAFASWVYRAATNGALSWARNQARRSRWLESFLCLVHDPSRHAAAADVAAEARDEAERLDWALERLDPADRALLALRFDEVRTFAEIATILELPTSTVKSRHTRVVKRLRAQLDPDLHPATPRPVSSGRTRT
jgi:RNA polymerase sigma-70 factor, ECF subfamily